MLKKFLEYIRITPKALVVIIILLVAIDGIVRLYWANLYRVPGRVRLVNEELTTLQTMRNEIRTAKGYKILFLGDSAAYGSAVQSSAQTVPAYLEQELNRCYPDKQVKVFNFAFKGYGMSENYFLLNSLADSGLDMVVYNVSINWFNRTKVLEHPNVLHLSDTYFGEPLVAKTGVLQQRTKKERLKDKINEDVGRIWSFYQNRSALTTLLLGKSLRARLSDLQLAITNSGKLVEQRQEEVDLYRPWHQKDWSVKLGKAGYTVGKLNLRDNNPQVVFYNLMREILVQKKIKALIYTSPQNFTLLNRWEMLDLPAWTASVGQLQDMTVRPGITFKDYSTLVDDRYFSDTVHLLAPGNMAVAEQLAQNIAEQWGGIKSQ
jgi:hypothetical protein